MKTAKTTLQALKANFIKEWTIACKDESDIEYAQEQVLDKYRATSFYNWFIIPYIELEVKSELIELGSSQDEINQVLDSLRKNW